MASPSTFSVRLPDDARAALQAAAAADGRSVSNLVQKIIAEWLLAEGRLKPAGPDQARS